MKTILMICAVALCSAGTWAQSVDVKSIDADSNGEGTTTIEIKKGKKDELKKDEVKWEVSDGSSDVEGEPAATAKDARATWKAACDSWKKELREDNKENKILAINCGAVSCGGDAGSKTCSSKATYKIKTRLN